jgi:hypothetical protein
MKATTRRSKRVSWDDLELLAFTNPGTQIEVDEENGIGVLTLTNPKREYVATLPERTP